jgi:hypothetical protein
MEQTELITGRQTEWNLLEVGRAVGALECVASGWSIRGGGMHQRHTEVDGAEGAQASEVVRIVRMHQNCKGFIRSGRSRQSRWRYQRWSYALEANGGIEGGQSRQKCQRWTELMEVLDSV